MSDAFDLIFDPSGLSTQVIFSGTHCGRENLLRTYPSGSLHFVRSGRAEALLAGSTPVLIEQPSLLFFPRAHSHSLRALDDGGIELVCAIATFSEGFRQSVALSFPEMVVVPLHELAPVRHAAEAFFAEAASKAPGSRQMADHLCAIVLAYLLRHLCETQEQQRSGLIAAAGDSRIASAIKAIHTCFHDGLDLETLARAAGMSRSRFVEHFKRLVGTSPHNYLVNYRIGVAQQLLARRLPVKTVAQRVGYATTAAFVRKFKDVVGVSPGAWAK
jgi:AraC-like DNA-binding protein